MTSRRWVGALAGASAASLLFVYACWQTVQNNTRTAREEASLWAHLTSNAFRVTFATFGIAENNSELFLSADRAFSTTMRLERGPQGWYASAGGGCQARIAFHVQVKSNSAYDVYAVYNTIESRPFSLSVNGIRITSGAAAATGKDYRPVPAVTAFVARVQLPEGISRFECAWPYATPVFFGLHCVASTGGVYNAHVHGVL